jgi:glycosyltransferase involved in cell wall biosynthesis
MRPLSIPTHVLAHLHDKHQLLQRIHLIKEKVDNLKRGEPEISIVIPAYNEEESILQTLSSLSASTTGKSVEIIVVDNNSKDKTAELAEACGARCILEKKQGITPARNAGLQAAKGKYVLNADADTIYPPDWIDLMTAPLHRENTAMVYGTFSFIPTADTSRTVYYAYEHVSDLSKWINKKFREEAVNIYGFNSAFRREEGLQVGGFDHPPGTNEDGWLGLKLRVSLNKKLCHVKKRKAIVWTSDRRIQIDGGLVKGTWKRLRRHLGMKD